MSKRIGELFRLINKSRIYLVDSYPKLKVKLFYPIEKDRCILRLAGRLVVSLGIIVK